MSWFKQTPKRKSSTRERLIARLRAGGDAARDRRNWETAATFYEKVVALDSSAVDIAIQLGHAYKEMGNYDRADEQYAAAVAQLPKDDDLQLQLGHFEKTRGNRAKALEYYRSAFALNSQNEDAIREYKLLSERPFMHPVQIASYTAIARPISVLGKLPDKSDAGNGFALRIKQIEQHLTAPHDI